MSNMNWKLRELLEHKTVLVLGAGASKEYGFPLWEELKTMMIEECAGDFPRRTEKNAAYYWVQELKNNTSDSVDDIAARAPKDEYFFFSRLVCYILLTCERSHLEGGDSELIYWISRFSFKLLRILSCDRGDFDFLGNLSFVNLNYDRSFSFSYQNLFVDKLSECFPIDRELEAFWRYTGNWSFRRVLHPHGVIADLKNNHFKRAIHIDSKLVRNTSGEFGTSSGGVGYGSLDDFQQAYFKDYPNASPVADFQDGPLKDGKGETYRRSIDLLTNAQNIIYIGVSEKGWRSSQLPKDTGGNVFSVGSANQDDSRECIAASATEFAERLI